MTLRSVAQEAARQLSLRNERVVCAESCTSGLLASTLGEISGVSNHFCGSTVVYRADSKRRWLGVRKDTIKKKTTESHEVAEQITEGVMKMTPEADWGLGIVGHLGPDAPKEKDGVIFICIVRRTRKGRLKIKAHVEHKLSTEGRLKRQQEAAEVVLTHFMRLLAQTTQKEEHKNRRKNRAIS